MSEPHIAPTSQAVAGGLAPASDATWVRLFDDRYGTNAFAQLIALFEQPCVTYARIAANFGVSRERVRQWHLALAPGSPRGQVRRRLCREYRLKRALLDDVVYRAFVRAARTQRPDLPVTPIRSRGGFRKRAAQFGPYVVALRRAGVAVRHNGTARSRTFSLTPVRADAQFVFYLLDEVSYLFVPAGNVPSSGTTFLDSPGSKYQPFKDRLLAHQVANHETVAR